MINVKPSVVFTIIENIKNLFKSLLESVVMYSGCTLLSVLVWRDGEETDMLIERDNTYLNMLAKRFKPPPGDPQL